MQLWLPQRDPAAVTAVIRQLITRSAQHALDARLHPSEIPLMSATCFDTPIGRCAIAWNAHQITGFSLPPAQASQDAPPPWVEAIISRVKRHLAGEAQDFADLPYAWNQAPTFQRAVYKAALQVKSGQTWSYGQLAVAIGQPPAAARDVGAALAQNPWPLLVPCHRFIASDGRMTGFSAPGGVKTKLRLLAIEGAELFAE
jgi:methylated-DNA-[protein]-cysteine S-methyltransferase